MSGKKFLGLIVDDEAKDRSVIRILLERQYGGLFELLEAENAAQALAMPELRQVELLMVDIHMPGVSGLNLVEELNARGIRPYTMVLTAYSYFEYAKEAIRCQVNDFILKPPIRKEFYEAVDRFLDWARKKKEIRRIGRDSQSVFSRALGNCILLGGGRQEIETYKKLLDISEKRVFCVLLEWGGSLPGQEAESAWKAVLEETGLPYILCPLQGRTAVFCFTDKETLDREERALAESLRRQAPGIAAAAVGESVSLFDNPGESYRSAAAQLSRPPEPRKEPPVEDLLSACVENGELETAVECLEQYLMRYWEQHNFDDLMLEGIKILTVVRKNARVREEAIGQKMLDIFVTGSIQDIIRFSADYLREIAEHQPLPAQEKKHHVVQSICGQVLEHLEQPWSLNDFAGQYGFNPVYLGRLFKEETGLSFTNYLMDKRIEKAIALLADPNLTIGAIGQAVGYNDQNYFSRVFKKHTRMGPNEYRRSLAGRSGEDGKR